MFAISLEGTLFVTELLPDDSGPLCVPSDGFLVAVSFGLEHFRVEGKLLLVQFVDSDHVLHALFEDLHFLLKLYFCFALLVSKFASLGLELTGVVFDFLGSLAEVVLLFLLHLCEEHGGVLLVGSQDGVSFLLVLSFDTFKLTGVV